MSSLSLSFFSSVRYGSSVTDLVAEVPGLLTLHGHHEVVQAILIELVGFLIVLLDIFVNRFLYDLDSFL